MLPGTCWPCLPGAAKASCKRPVLATFPSPAALSQPHLALRASAIPPQPFSYGLQLCPMPLPSRAFPTAVPWAGPLPASLR